MENKKNEQAIVEIFISKRDWTDILALNGACVGFFWLWLFVVVVVFIFCLLLYVYIVCVSICVESQCSTLGIIPQKPSSLFV